MTKSRSGKAILLASGRGLSALVGIATAAVLARVFSKFDYATYRQTLLAYTFAAPFLMLGLDRALFYFLPAEKNRPRAVLVENLLLVGTAGTLLALFLLVGGNRFLASRFHNADLATTLLILAPYPVAMSLASSLSPCLLARDRVGGLAKFLVASRILMLFAVLVPTLLWPRPVVAIAGTVVGAVVVSGISLVLMFRACPGSDWLPSKVGLRQQLVFAIPLGLAGLAGTVDRSIDKVMVGALTTPETFAVYVNGAIEIPLIGVLTGSVAAVLIVEYNRLHREDRHGEIVALIHRAMVKCSLVILPVMLLFLCVAPELMRLIYGAGYEGSAAPFRVYLLLLPIRTLNFGAILMATKKSHHVLVQSVITLVANVILTYYAVLLMGAIGAAIASVLVVYLVAVPYLVVVLRKVLACPAHRLFPWRQLFKVGMASAGGIVGIVILRRFMPTWPDVLSLALSSTIWIIGTAVLFWALRLANPLETLRILYDTYWDKGQFAPVSSAEASSSNDA